MDADRWAQLKDAFAALSELPSAEREVRLAALAVGDPELARRIRELLEADSRADAVLNRYDLAPDSSGAPLEDLSSDGESGVSAPSDPFGYSGQTVAQYRVLDVLGAGGMGVVYRAEDASLGRSVALKFLLPQYAVDPVAKQRFLREARAASSLDHPNVCTVFGFGESERGHLFLAMACYDGETLRARLARAPMSVADATRIARQILVALDAAHGAGIVHRDLKPGNVMLAPDATVKILDFGLAKVSDLALTGPGFRPGTVAYMSPEQIEGKPVDQRSDLWSLGVLLYEMLTGQRPFGSGQDLSTIYAILNDEPQPPSKRRPDVPREYDAIVNRLLRKDRDERYASAADAIAELDAVSADSSVRNGPASPRQRTHRSLLAAGLIGVVLIGGGLASLPDVRGSIFALGGSLRTLPATLDTVPDADARSVAVLPFVDMSPGQDQAYFSDGVTEEILNALAQVPELRVPARTSSFSFKGRNVQVRDIARQLGVAAVLEGSVRKDGNRVRITAQLIDARSDRHVWSQTFERELEDVFAVQSEIARIVAEALEVRLADRGRVGTSAATPTARAHDLYLQGRFHWNRRSGEDLRRAIRYFEDATRADSTYARAFAGLAMAYAVLPMTVGESPAEGALARAEETAGRAIALDPSLAESYAALGYAYHLQWRWEEADRALRRATELEPSNATARQWYGEHLAKMGRGEDAEAELRRAVLLDPLSPIANSNLGLVLLLDGRYGESIAQLEHTSQMDPSFSVPLILLHRVYLAVGRTEESATAGRRFAEVVGLRNADDFVTLAHGTRTRSERRAALAVLDRWKQGGRAQWPEIAMYYVVLGERDQAIEALERGFRERAPMMAGLKALRWLDPLRSDPRFARMVRAMRFP